MVLDSGLLFWATLYVACASEVQSLQNSFENRQNTARWKICVRTQHNPNVEYPNSVFKKSQPFAYSRPLQLFYYRQHQQTAVAPESVFFQSSVSVL